MEPSPILHGDKVEIGGQALRYGDDFSLWRLNGVTVPSELVTTPGAKLDVQLLVKETNAEVRREIVRKIGLERICAELHAVVIDEWKDYQLLLLDVHGVGRPYLKMINPSVGARLGSSTPMRADNSRGENGLVM